MIGLTKRTRLFGAGMGSRSALIAAAALSEAVYALAVMWPMRIWHRAPSPVVNVVGTFGVDRAGALHYVAVVAVLFALYAAALWWLRRPASAPAPRSRWAVALGGAVVFCLTLLLAHPLSSADVFSYIASARTQWLYGDNPLTTPPLAHPDDAVTRLLIFWRDLPSPYGPLWSLLTWLPHTAAGGSITGLVVAFKSLAAGFFLATVVLVALTAERLRPGSGPLAAVALGWNPLAAWEVAGNGHNDAVMICFLALAAYLLVRGLPGPGALAFTAAALVKFPALLVLPAVAVWWWRSGRVPSVRRLVPWLALSLAAVVLMYAPYWAGWETFRAQLHEGDFFGVSGQAALRGLLLRVMGAPRAESITLWLGHAAFLGVYGLLLRRLRGRDLARLFDVSALALTAFLLLAAPYFGPWYVLWPLTLAALTAWRRRALLPVAGMSLGAMGVLLWATWARERFAPRTGGDWYPMDLLSFAGTALPVLGAVAWQWYARQKREPAPSADVDAPVLLGEVARARPEG